MKKIIIGIIVVIFCAFKLSADTVNDGESQVPPCPEEYEDGLKP